MADRVLSLFARSTRLRAEHRRTILLGTAASIILHVAAVIALRPVQIFPDPGQPAVIGYRGPTRLMELAPKEDVQRTQLDLAQRRIRAGAIMSGDLVYDDPEPPEVTTPDAVEPAPPRPAEPRPEPTGSEEPIVLELSDDWQRYSPEALSEMYQVTRIVRPEYPTEAIRGNQQGIVSLEVRVGISGRVLNVRILESPHGSRSLERAAVESMLDWEFRPFIVNNNPVQFTVIVPFRFRLVD